MSDAADAWLVVGIAELAAVGEELLRRTLGVLDPDARASMSEDGGWVLSGSDAEELRTLLAEHGEIAERLRTLSERLPEQGVTATYADVRDGAAAVLADGILDPAALVVTASALDVRTGWVALADALASTDVRGAWTELTLVELLESFRDADRRLVTRALTDVGVEPDMPWPELSLDQTRRLARTLRAHAESL
jgi:hypothetical protein